MPRRSYEEHRARRFALGRNGSIVESETDADSIASYTTYQSNSSYLTQGGVPSPRLGGVGPSSSSLSAFAPQSQSTLHPSILQNHHLGNVYPSNPSLKPRTFSSSSSIASPAHLDVPSTRKRTSGPTNEERERRRKRREERSRRSTLLGEKYDSPLRRLLRWMSTAGLSHWSLIVGLLGVGIVKLAAGYIGSSRRDKSQRLATPASVTDTPLSIFSVEALFWWSSVVLWIMSEGEKGGRSWRSQMTGIMTVLLQPSLMLVDNGLLQYNSVLLGLSLWTVIFLSRGHDILACAAFSCAMSLSPLGLYYAPAIACYLLGKCIWLGGQEGLVHLAKLGFTSLATLAVLISPWFKLFHDALRHVLHSIASFAIVNVEETVGNLSSVSNEAARWKVWLPAAEMNKLAAIATFVSLLPTMYILLRTSYSARSSSLTVKSLPDATKQLGATSTFSVPPTARLLLISLFVTSLSCFLSSFPISAESILLPLMPLTVMMAMRGGKEGAGEDDEFWEVGVLVNNVAVFGMWPLLVREGQLLPCILITLLWNYLLGYTPWTVQSDLLRLIGYIVYTLMALIRLPDLFPSSLAPPPRYPELLNALLCLAVFSLSWLWGTKKLIEGAWALGGLGGHWNDKHGKKIE